MSPAKYNLMDKSHKLVKIKVEIAEMPNWLHTTANLTN